MQKEKGGKKGEKKGLPRQDSPHGHPETALAAGKNKSNQTLANTAQCPGTEHE